MILCRLGLHRWAFVHAFPLDDAFGCYWATLRVFRCARCGKGRALANRPLTRERRRKLSALCDGAPPARAPAAPGRA